MRKKLLSILALLCLTVTSAWAQAPDLKDGDSWDAGTGTLTVNSNPGFYYACGNMIHLIIGSGVTSIDDDAFSQCEGLTTVDYAAGPQLTSIGARAFASCPALTSINLPPTVTSIGDNAFNPSGLTTIDIPASVKSVGNSAFLNCSNLATITFNSTPFIDEHAFDGIADGATVTMNLAANSADGAYWMTFYNDGYNFQADANTQIFKVKLTGNALALTKLNADQIVTQSNAVLLRSTGTPIVMTLVSAGGSNDFGSNDLVGVSIPEGRETDGTLYVLNYKEGTGVGFYRLADGQKVGVGKAYVVNWEALGRDFLGFDEATDLNELSGQKEDVTGVYYDLHGRRIEHPTNGIYIVNGKKRVIK